MAIQTRRGEIDKLDISKLLPGEWATCTDGTIVICYAAGKTKKVISLNEIPTRVENVEISSDDIAKQEIIITFSDGNILSYPIRTFEKSDYDFKYDVETGLFELLKNGEVKRDAIITGSSNGSGSVSRARLTNQNGTSTLVFSYGNAAILMFTFVSTEDDLPTGNGNCKVSVNGIQKINMSIPQGLTSLDVSPYLSIGSNTVVVTCTDVYGKSRSLTYDVQQIKLTIKSLFDATVPYEGDITFKYTPYGSVEKTIHFVVDGKEINHIITTLSGNQLTRIIPAMTHGVHRLEVYSTATMEDTTLESPKLVYDVMCTEKSDISAMIASVYQVAAVNQGEQVSIPYIVLDPTKLACDIVLDIYTMESGSEVIYSSQKLTVDRSQQIWNTRKYPVGTVYFRIKYGEISKVHCVTVEKSRLQIEAETNNLELYLTSEGRSNYESNPAVWSYGDISTKFENLNWSSTGWIDDENGDTCLRLNGDAKAEIQFQPFKDDIRTYGKTIELEFTIRDVNKRDSTVISCLSGGIGFEVKADTAYIKSEQSKVFCNYKDDDNDRDDEIEKVRLTFVVEARSEYRLLSIYLNGIRSDTIQYPTTDNFQQTTPVNITIGSPYCSIDLYTVRSYATALTPQSIVTNMIADMTDIVRKTEIYENNDIYDEYGKISFAKAKEKNSVMVIVGDLPQSKGDKKTVQIYYYDIEDSSLNFIELEVSIDVQGTSSQWYVRKNWKIKFPNEHRISDDQLPAKVICIKVDYAEHTGTHNTQTANFVHTLYDEMIPPQADNAKIRTTIYGKPILLFHQADENSDPVFYGKANFNYDKGAENVFAFSSDYDVECWEFCNNTSDACNFLAPIPDNWGDDFEARYPEDYTDISRFKVIHDWVVSTRQDTATGNALSSTYTDVDGNTYTHDTAEYRLAKFKTEFENYFNMHYALVYYTWTFFSLATDQRTKNMFLTFWGIVQKLYAYFYDCDTIFGINNEGQLVFDYYHEDTDQVDGANVYNGQNNVLWRNFREAFPDKIKEIYQHWRSSGKLTYDKLTEAYITNGSDKWSESIYNEDGDYKYISMLRTDNDASNLPQVRGSGEEHLRYFIKNRLNYCDSKWYASEYANDYISLRIYTPVDENGIPRTDLTVAANADITVIPYSHMYTGVRYKANGTLYQKRVAANETVIFEAPDEVFNDTETAIYGASQLSSLGNLAPLYCGSVNVSMAIKLVVLIIGSAIEGYSNPNLKELSVGTNRLLKLIDIQNCPNFTSSLSLTGCPNIEEVYAKGSGITGIELVKGGHLKIAELPATITNLTLDTQLYIETLTLENYDNLKTLWIENCPTVDSMDILNKGVNIERVRLTDVDWHYDDASTLYELMERDIAGIDENGVNIDYMWIDGKCHIKTLTGAEYLEVKEVFPYMTITYDTLTSELIFMSEDGSEELTRQTIQNGGDGVDPITNGTIEDQTKESTAQYDYTRSGWSLTPGGEADPDALKHVEADRIVYVAFSATLRKYTVKFYNGTTLLQTVNNVPYGSTATYTGETPTNTSTGNTADFEFYGWSPSPTNIQGDTSCYAQYHDLREITDSWATIAAACLDGTATSKYAVGAFKTLDIGAVDLPYNFYDGSAVVLNDEIHILGSYDSSYRTAHYKWNGTEWTSVSTLPYNFYDGSAVVLNDEIHILGSYDSGSNTAHYKWNGTEWTSVSTLPYNFYDGSAVVLNDEIHILGSYSSGPNTAHYKWNGTEWTSVSTLPYNFYNASAVVLNDEIHILGSASSNIYHKSFYSYSSETQTWSKVGLTDSIPMQIVAHNHDELADDTNASWESVSTLPHDSFYQGDAVVYNNELHILGNGTNHYKWDGAEWTSVSTLPYTFSYGRAVVYNGCIHIFGKQYGSTNHYKWDGSSWTEASTLPYAFTRGGALIYNNELHLVGSVKANCHSYHYKWDETNSEWVSVSTIPMDFADPSSMDFVVYDGKIHGFFGGLYHKVFDGTEWTTLDDTIPFIPYYNCHFVVHENAIHLIGGASDGVYDTSHYKWNSTDGWTFVSNTVSPHKYGCAIVFRSKLHILGAGYNNEYTKSHYTYSNPRATLTFVAQNLLSEPRKLMNDWGYDHTSYGTTHLREYLNGDFVSSLPSDLQTSLSDVKKYYGYFKPNVNTCIISGTEKCWIPSMVELGVTTLINDVEGEGSEYSVFTDNDSRKKSMVNGDPVMYWTRSVSTYQAGRYFAITNQGTGYDSAGTMSQVIYEQGVLLGFCI